jgi:hypothetical protein
MDENGPALPPLLDEHVRHRQRRQQIGVRRVSDVHTQVHELGRVRALSGQRQDVRNAPAAHQEQLRHGPCRVSHPFAPSSQRLDVVSSML